MPRMTRMGCFKDATCCLPGNLPVPQSPAGGAFIDGTPMGDLWGGA
jgi:hypothetical protein